MTILRFDATPHPTFYMTPEQEGMKDLPFLGFEVEVLKRAVRGGGTSEYVAQCAQHLADSYPYIYCKHDGSIVRGDEELGVPEHTGGAGFEVVSHPFTYEWLKSDIRSLNWVDYLRKKKFVSWQANTCALHIHISKASVSKPEQYRMYKFFQLHDEFLYKIAGRHGEWMNKYASIDKIKQCGDSELRSYANNVWPDKYIALRNEKSSTIEFRIFRGTLSKEGICRGLEFVLSLRAFCKVSSLKDLTNLGNFFRYVQDNRYEYPHLFKWLIANNYI